MLLTPLYYILPTKVSCDMGTSSKKVSTSGSPPYIGIVSSEKEMILDTLAVNKFLNSKLKDGRRMKQYLISNGRTLMSKLTFLEHLRHLSIGESSIAIGTRKTTRKSQRQVEKIEKIQETERQMIFQLSLSLTQFTCRSGVDKYYGMNMIQDALADRSRYEIYF